MATKQEDLIIGASYNLRNAEVRTWAQSARESGFTGRIVLLNYAEDHRGSDALGSLAEATGMDVVHVPLPRKLINGRQVCQLRFREYASEWLWERLGVNPRYVIATDVRDVLFQRDPSEYFKARYAGIVAPSERISIGNEPWNATEMRVNFPYAFETLRHRAVLNAGTFAVRGVRKFQQLSAQVYAMCEHRALGSDQPAFNFALYLTPASHEVELDSADAGWAAQMAVWAKPELHQHLVGGMPQITLAGKVVTQFGLPYIMVHQYDRFPALAGEVRQRYS